MAFTDAVLRDYCDGAAVHPRWGISGGVTEGSGVITIPCTAAYPSLFSATSSELSGSFLHAKVTVPGFGGGTRQNGMQLLAGGDNNLEWYCDGANLYGLYKINGAQTVLASLSYSASTHAWWRIREQSGVCYWDTSADGLAWTLRGSAATPIPITTVTAAFYSGYYGAESAADMTVDNINVYPVTIDANTPASVGVASGNATTAAFTAPAGSLLLAFANMNSLSGGNSVGPSILDSGGLTWTEIASAGPSFTHEEAVVWSASAPTAASRTVTATAAVNTANKYLQVMVFTGADAAVGNVRSGEVYADGALSVSCPCTRTGGQLWCAYADWNNAGLPAAAAGSTVRSSYDGSNTDGATVYKTLSGTRGTDMTVATSTPAGARLSYVAVEVLPAASESRPPVAACSVALSGDARTDVTDPGLSWTTLAGADFRSAVIRRGFSGEVEDPTPGRCTVVMDNYGGDYDPGNGGGAHHPDLTMGKPVQVVAPWAGTEYVRYRGFIDDIVPDHGRAPLVVIECVDSLAQLGQAHVARLSQPAHDGDRSGTRLGRILDAVGVPAGARRLDAGQTRLQATAFGENAQTLVHAVVGTELGWFFVAASGEIVFYDRYRTLEDRSSTAARVTFSDTGADVDMTAIRVSGLSKSVFNGARVTRQPPPAYGFADPHYPAGWVPTPAERSADDAASADAHGPRDYPRQLGRLGRADGYSLALAQWLVRRYKDPVITLDRVEVDATAQGQWARLLELDLLHRVRAVRTYGAPTPVAVDRQALILGYTETIARDGWTFDLALIDASRLVADRFTLGKSRLGPAGPGKLGY